MKIIEVEQGSAAWLALRLKMITATDSGSILGINPYKSAIDVYQEKWGKEPQPVNERMRRGSELEPIIREMVCEELGIDFKPAVVINESYDWMMASLDGISPCGRFLCEIKAPSMDVHNLAIAGQIKPYYFSQCQHQLGCTKADICYYASYLPSNYVKPLCIIEVKPDWEYIERMIAMEKEFYEKHVIMCCPPEQKTLKLRQ